VKRRWNGGEVTRRYSQQLIKRLSATSQEVPSNFSRSSQQLLKKFPATSQEAPSNFSRSSQQLLKSLR
jgi:hypothetical protein